MLCNLYQLEQEKKKIPRGHRKDFTLLLWKLLSSSDG